MASELLKRQALINRLKEPKTANIDFDLAGSALDYSIESIEEDILPKAKPAELFEERERVRTERLSDTLTKIGGGLMDESVDFIKREELKYGGTFKEYINREDKYEDFTFEEWLREDKAKGGRIGFAKGTPFQITDQKLAAIDKLIKETDLDLKSIGKQIGYGTDKTQLKIDAPVMKAYIEKYGKPKPGRLKPANLAKDPEYVQFVIDKVKEQKGNKKAVSKELGIDRKTINNILKQKAPELMKPENIPGPDTGEKAVKKRAKEIVKEGEKKAGPKTTKQARQVITNIGNRNKIYANMSAEELAKDKKFLNRLRLTINGKTGDVDFTGYTEANPVRGKVFNDIELAQHAINKAKDGKLFTHDHITPKRFRKQNIQYPINFQPVTYMENSQFENARTYLTENPDGNVSSIDSYLKSNNKTIRFGKNKYGYTGNIVYNSKTGDQTLLDFEKTPGEKKLTAFQELINRKGSGVDPDLAARAVKEQFVDPLTSRVPTGKGIRALSTAGKIALPETYFAPASIVLDTYAGRTPKEMALNVATLGFGAPALDAYKKAQALKKKGLLDEYKKAVAKANRADQALAEEVETLGMDTPAEEFAKPQFTVGEQIAALAGMEEDKKLSERLEQKAAEYQKLRENQLKKGLLEVTPDDEPLLEEIGIKPELLFQEEEEESLGFFDRATGNVPRGFMSEGGIMAIRNKDKSDETN